MGGLDAIAFTGGVGQSGSQQDAGPDKRPRLGAVQPFQLGLQNRTAFAFQIHDLAPDHAIDGPYGGSHQLKGAHRPGRADLEPCQHFKGERQQRIPRQDGSRLAELDVARRHPAAQVIIVHGRQVVMDQRVGVDHLHGG